MALDDKLAIVFILNTAKQETTTFVKTLQTEIQLMTLMSAGHISTLGSCNIGIIWPAIGKQTSWETC